MGRCEVEAPGSGQKPVTGFCEHDNEPSDSIKVGEFLDYLTISFSRRILLHGVS
jgi:hypothetical protein